jgi:hypothetical protein
VDFLGRSGDLRSLLLGSVALFEIEHPGNVSFPGHVHLFVLASLDQRGVRMHVEFFGSVYFGLFIVSFG